jgi:hypothetical protein
MIVSKVNQLKLKANMRRYLTDNDGEQSVGGVQIMVVKNVGGLKSGSQTQDRGAPVGGVTTIVNFPYKLAV